MMTKVKYLQIPNVEVPHHDWQGKYQLQSRAFVGWRGATGWGVGLSRSTPSVVDGMREQTTVQFWRRWSGYDPETETFDPQVYPLHTALTVIHAAVDLGSKIMVYGDPDLPFYESYP